jgi:hypothetical protein
MTPTDDAGVLRTAITDAALNLAEAIGINRTDQAGPAAPRMLCKVDRDRVPAAAFTAAVTALDYLSVAIGIMDPADPSSVGDVDADLAALDPRRRTT